MTMTGSRLLPQALRFLGRRKRVLLKLTGWSLLESAHTFLGGYGVAMALDRGFLAGRTGTGLAWLAVAALAVVIGGLATGGVFRGLADLVEPLRDGLVRRVVTRSLDEALAEPALAADSAVVSRLTNQTEIARDSFAGLVLVARSFVFTSVGALFGLAALSPALLVVVVPPLVTGLLLFLATLAPMAARQHDFLCADEALAAQFGSVAQGLRDVVACGAGAPMAARTHVLIEQEAKAARSLARWASARSLSLGVAGHLPVVLLLVAAPWLRRQGVTAGALLGALTYLTQALLPALHHLMSTLGAAGTRLLVVLGRLSRVPGPRLAVPSPAGTPERPAQAPAHPDVPRVELRAVTFAYGAAAQPVLRGLEVTIEPGEHLAVVGPSGIGKSTLTCLLAGLLEPDEGEVRLHGRPAHAQAGRGAAPSRLRVLIPQQAYVFTGSLYENLLYLCPDGAPRSAVEASSEAVGLGTLVHRLGGFDAQVEPAALSHGERQLIALARAHVSPAPLVILDEATCHLDPAAEARAEQAFAERPGTLIVVAHRISSARRADRILVLDGLTAACGSHQELIDRSPLYRDLVGRWHAEKN
ncbi:ATP-binding cassette domain-containing protein [Streptomyces xantholiticus]|uniref:ATP-binding cassette domain-containing protein n=1 Tax=Streptomyces xantholiticus TaxID=68285 RepID=UPI00167B9CF2|nr:ABC transporter ATP-binding protein [Streptomyces xantholiticus]